MLTRVVFQKRERYLYIQICMFKHCEMRKVHGQHAK